MSVIQVIKILSTISLH